jgi:hypothetical protein
MVFDSIYRKETDFLCIKYKGNETDSVLSSLNEVFEKCKSWNYSKLLIYLNDFDIDVVSDMDRFYFGEKIADLCNIIHRMKIAVILNERDFAGIGENAAVNRFIDAKSFYNKIDSIKWLLE